MRFHTELRLVWLKWQCICRSRLTHPCCAPVTGAEDSATMKAVGETWASNIIYGANACHSELAAYSREVRDVSGPKEVAERSGAEDTSCCVPFHGV